MIPTKGAVLSALKYRSGISITSFSRDQIVCWNTVIRDLQSMDFTFAAIARETGLNLSSVKYYRYTPDVKISFEDALPLIALWQKIMETPADFIPCKIKMKKELPQSNPAPQS